MDIYEYLFVAIIIIAMLVASTAMVDILSKPARDASEKEQLKVTAQKIMTQILLDPGFPFDWGSNLNGQPSMFGLGKYGETSREAYVLDPDKVQRLNTQIGVNRVPPSIALQLLNLGHDYGFNIEFSENLHITYARISNAAEEYKITVTSYFDRMPLANTKIAAALYDTQAENITRRGSASNITGFDGTCDINFNLPIGSQRETMIVLAEYYGAHATKIFPLGSDYVQGYLFSNQVISNTEYSLYHANQAPAAKEALMMKQDENYTISEFDAGEADSTGSLVLEGEVEPSAVAVLASVKDQADNASMLVAYRDLTINYTSIEGVRSTASSYSLERTVLIAGTTYTVTLYLWRMAD